MIWLFVMVVAAVLGVLAFMWTRRGQHHEPGVASFRRHIDALSPEARREVHDRVRAQRDGKDRR